MKLPMCRKCNKEMRDASFLMMGVQFKCFDCEEVITCHQWELKRYEEEKKRTRKGTQSVEEI
jgi:phage FluMu protein Com